MTTLQARIIENQRKEIAALKAELTREAFYHNAASATILDRDNECKSLFDTVLRLSRENGAIREELEEVKRDKQALAECWREAEARAQQYKSRLADSQTAYNLSQAIAARHAARADKAIESLEAIGWQFAIASFSTADVDSLIDEELEGREYYDPRDEFGPEALS